MNTNSVDLLLVEDNVHDAELTIRELKKHNIANNLFHVTDGEQAINFLFGTGEFSGKRGILRRPQLILLDINMPKLDGIEVLKRIKQDERTRSIAVVILTSSREDPHIQICHELGANNYLVKPVNFEKFAKSIRNAGFYLFLMNHHQTN